MAVDIISPRISFSHDLKELDFIPIETQIANPTLDFDFCINQTFPQEISSADELFANGKILPTEIKKLTPPKVAFSNTKKTRLIEFLSNTFDEEEEDKPITKPFWQFRRSSSVNSDHNTRTNNGLLRSFNFLTRSNSTGSVPSQKFPKVMRKQSSLKEVEYSPHSSSYRPVYDQYYPYNDKKGYLRKSKSGSYGNVVRISPVLNIHPTYIAKGTVSLFGIGSFFCSGKKSKKKRK